MSARACVCYSFGKYRTLVPPQRCGKKTKENEFRRLHGQVYRARAPEEKSKRNTSAGHTEENSDEDFEGVRTYIYTCAHRHARAAEKDQKTWRGLFVLGTTSRKIFSRARRVPTRLSSRLFSLYPLPFFLATSPLLSISLSLSLCFVAASLSSDMQGVTRVLARARVRCIWSISHARRWHHRADHPAFLSFFFVSSGWEIGIERGRQESLSRQASERTLGTVISSAGLFSPVRAWCFPVLGVSFQPFETGGVCRNSHRARFVFSSLGKFINSGLGFVDRARVRWISQKLDECAVLVYLYSRWNKSCSIFVMI